MPIPSGQSCENCLFFVSLPSDCGDGTCNKFPPTPGRQLDPYVGGQSMIAAPSEFPIVLNADWCGEWKKAV